MIELIFLDIDGCLTNGRITYIQNGGEIKEFDVRDGTVVEVWLKLGKKIAIITGRNSPCVEQRAKDLKTEFAFQGIKDKLGCAKELLVELNLDFSRCTTIGDYHNDKALLEAVKLSFKPKDAHKNLKVDIKFKKRGGCGAVAQMMELIIGRNATQKGRDTLRR